jgi:cell fate regulator YaaT (PSP1 superfamily)
MSCSSCSSGKDGQPAGCRSNGTCGTGSCNKLNVYNWLTDMVLPAGQSPYDIVEVRFKGSRKEFFRNAEVPDLKAGDVVAVESSPGHDVGVVSMVGELVRFQLRKKGMTETSEGIRALYRKAKPNEVEKWLEVKDKEPSMLMRTRSVIQSLKLQMKLSDVEFQGDGKKATFYYTADERVDFRELIKRLADEFRIRVEMRQIGMRQEASRVGGIGVCGLELCCSTWLTDFKTVSTSAARYQNLALNPAKLAGQCGKLKCCLNYELDSYMDIMREFPQTNVVLETEKGRAVHQKTDIFKKLLWYAYLGNKREGGEGFDGPDGGNWVAIPLDRVKEIIALNKAGKKAGDLLEGEWLEVEDEKEKEPDYLNVVGQDRIDRMDKKKKKKKKKKPGEGNRPQGPRDTSSGDGGAAEKPAASNKPQQPQQKQQRPQGQEQRRQPQGQRPQQRENTPRPQPQQQPKPQQQNKPAPQSGQPPRPQGNRPPRQQPPKSQEGKG